MKFKATKLGFLGSRVRPGQVFDAPKGFNASWAEPSGESVAKSKDAAAGPDPFRESNKQAKKSVSRKKKKSRKTD